MRVRIHHQNRTDGTEEQMKQVSQGAGGPVAEDENKKRRKKQGYGEDEKI